MQTDTTTEFEAELAQWDGFATKQNRDGSVYTATDSELATLLQTAKHARAAAPWMWAKLYGLLKRHGGFKNDKDIRQEVSRARVHASLGCNPHTVQEFVPAWLSAKGYAMAFSGLWSQHGSYSPDDNDFILNEMKLWCVEMGEFGGGKMIDAAFANWAATERKHVQRRTFEMIRFDAAVDPGLTELRKFVDLMIAGTDDPAETARIRDAAVVAFATFIFRVKNHMRYRWFNSAHLMIVLQGVQGDGKTFALDHFLSVLGDLSAHASLEVLRDKSMSYQFSVLPVMMFEEMAGAGKADIDALKAIMTDDKKLLREIYKAASIRKIVSTFIGASNKDIRNLIRDETGNRRTIQFESNRKVPREAIRAIDVAKIWKSVDENALEPPQYASEENAALIAAVQEGQRVLGPVEQWLLECDTIPWDRPTKASKLFAGSFADWAESGMSKAEWPFWNPQRLAATLRELAQHQDRYDIRVTKTGGSDSFRLQRPHGVETTPTARTRAGRQPDTIEVMRQEIMADLRAKANVEREQWDAVEASTSGLVQPSERLRRLIEVQTGTPWRG